jgi:DNA polymerase-1
MKERILILDGLNAFFRAYIVNPSLSTNGQPIGGLVGFLKILQKLCRQIKPDHVVIAWDGAGGSRRRKAVNKNYKEGRKPIRLNRDIRNLSENEELQNKMWQHMRLFEYINMMPVSQIMIDGVEADDIIAIVTNSAYLKDCQKIIVSSDKDFIQLCDDNTILFRPIQNEILNTNRIVDQFGIHPNNFALARAVAGDKSDNLDGVGSAGLKTIAKRFPFLAEDKTHEISTLLEHCKDEEKKLKVHQNIIDKEKLIRQNYKLMQLYAPSLPIQAKQKIKSSILDLDFSLNKTAIRTAMIEDGFGAYDWSTLFQTFQRIISNKEKK